MRKRPDKHDPLPKGVPCPTCGYTESGVLDSRNTVLAIRRRRECLACGTRFTTYERFVGKFEARRK